jgi:hydrogenase maturation protease
MFNVEGSTLNVLILGYGNPDRQDDGVAWHILQELATYYDCPITTIDELEVNPASSPRHSVTPRLAFALQLTPEMAETLARYEQVCFIDAHTGAYPEEIRVAPIEPGYQTTPFTHHLTPASCLALAQTLYNQAPIGIMVSVRGYHFGYSPELSPQTAPLAQAATIQIINWIISLL